VKQDAVLAQVLLKKSECLALEQTLRGGANDGVQLKLREPDVVIQHLKTNRRVAPKK
jgi:hypothetical protein